MCSHSFLELWSIKFKREPSLTIVSVLMPCPCFHCTPPLWLLELQRLVTGADRELVLSLPCVGVSAPAQACKALGIPFRGSEVADLERELEPALKQIHCSDPLLLRAVEFALSSMFLHGNRSLHLCTSQYVFCMGQKP